MDLRWICSRHYNKLSHCRSATSNTYFNCY
ncbi:unnamed protein product [Strongylus vulgaris]|uniref:Uncharacterized protein n=1 Tax=Strongylus vulgaris TaxID=40348 RepID=A0A3P7I9D7_STRVU|nr:unnamed protein product [Strongylus vulgaris]